MENFQITLKLPVQWVNVVLTALGEQPHKAVAETYASIRTQAQAQIDAAKALDEAAKE